MAFADPITLTYATVATTMDRINQDNYGSEYYGVQGLNKLTLSVKHTIPARGKFGESHLARLDVEHYDADGVLLRTSSAWTVIRTDNGIQDATSSDNAAQCLVDFLTDANIDKLVGRQS